MLIRHDGDGRLATGTPPDWETVYVGLLSLLRYLCP